jgi:hypothetical protein
MNNSKYQYIAFLDVLGFSNAVEQDEVSASEILQTAAYVLSSHSMQSLSKNNNKYLDVLSIRRSTTSFIHFLPLSDSIFIVSNDIKIFIQQLSSFLIACYLFTAHNFSNPKNESDPTTVIMKKMYFDINKNIQIIPEEVKSFPIIFRGGIGYGKITAIDSFCIIDGEKQKTKNVVGKQVVKAISLEKNSGKGPKIFISNAVYNNLDKINKRFCEKISDEVYSYNWLVYAYIEQNNYESEWTTFTEITNSAISLWKAFNHEQFGIQYYEFVKLSVRAFYIFVETYDTVNIEKCKIKIEKYLKEKGMGIKIKDMLKNL